MTDPRLLVVDRDSAFAADLKRLAEDVGFTVDLATTSADFQRRYLSHGPDILAMEVFLPGLDGLELIGWLVEQGCSAPLLAFTSRGSQYLRAAESLATLKGRFAVTGFAKPVPLPELRLALESARAGLLRERAVPASESDQPNRRDPRSPILESAKVLGELHRELEQARDGELALAALEIEKEILQRPAGNVEEAAVRLMLTASLVDRLAAEMQPDHSGHMTLISERLRSILTLISSIVAVDLGKFGGRWYLPNGL